MASASQQQLNSLLVDPKSFNSSKELLNQLTAIGQQLTKERHTDETDNKYKGHFLCYKRFCDRIGHPVTRPFIEWPGDLIFHYVCFRAFTPNKNGVGCKSGTIRTNLTGLRQYAISTFPPGVPLPDTSKKGNPRAFALLAALKKMEDSGKKLVYNQMF